MNTSVTATSIPPGLGRGLEHRTDLACAGFAFASLALVLDLREDARKFISSGAGAASADPGRMVGSRLDELRRVGEQLSIPPRLLTTSVADIREALLLRTPDSRRLHGSWSALVAGCHYTAEQLADTVCDFAEHLEENLADLNREGIATSEDARSVAAALMPRITRLARGGARPGRHAE